MILRAVAPRRETLRAFLRETWSFSGRLIKEAAREKKIFVDTRSRRMDYLLTPGERVLVDLGWEKNTYAPFPRELEILYEDEGMLVINKDPYCSVHPAGGNREDTVLNAVAHYASRSGEDFKIRFAHRLDRDTTGVLIVAKNKWIHEMLAAQFRQGRVRKEYLALVHGPAQEHFIVSGRMGLSEDGIRREFREDGKESRTEFSSLRRGPGWTLVCARPQTGRTHQLRVHLASRGHPVLGDSLYGREDGAPRQMLHCRRLTLTHPLTKEALVLEAPLKADFLKEMENTTDETL